MRAVDDQTYEDCAPAFTVVKNENGDLVIGIKVEASVTYPREIVEGLQHDEIAEMLMGRLGFDLDEDFAPSLARKLKEANLCW